jgi:hypothetical protein
MANAYGVGIEQADLGEVERTIEELLAIRVWRQLSPEEHAAYVSASARRLELVRPVIDLREQVDDRALAG